MRIDPHRLLAARMASFGKGAVQRGVCALCSKRAARRPLVADTRQEPTQSFLHRLVRVIRRLSRSRLTKSSVKCVYDEPVQIFFDKFTTLAIFNYIPVFFIQSQLLSINFIKMRLIVTIRFP